MTIRRSALVLLLVIAFGSAIGAQLSAPQQAADCARLKKISPSRSERADYAVLLASLCPAPPPPTPTPVPTPVPTPTPVPVPVPTPVPVPVPTPTPVPTPVPVPTSPPPSDPGGRVTGLTEVCTFTLPAGNFGGKSGGFDYGGSALMFNPAKGTLLLVGHVYDQMTAEVTIPACGGTATVVSNFTDLLEGRLLSVGTDSNGNRIGGQLLYNGKLYLSDFIYYDASGAQTLSHFVRPADLTVKGQVSGPFRAGPLGAGFYSGYMTTVPAAWQGALGGPALTGNCCLSIVSRTSYGPSVASFDPEHLGTATELVGYPQDHQTLGAYADAGPNPIFNGSTRIKGLLFIGSSVIFTGRTGLGVRCYGEAAACGDPTNTYKGEHMYPYAMYAWAYDANDLAAVKSGAKRPYDVRPYATWTLPGSGNDEYSGASTYDPTTGRIYVVEQNGGAGPIVHVMTAKQ